MTPAEARAEAVLLRGRAVAWARSYGLAPSSAEDVAHDSLELLLARADVVARGSAAAWLRAVVLNKARAAHRAPAIAEPVEQPSAAPDPEDTLVSQQLSAEVADAMERIERSRRTILRAVVGEGRSLVDVAAEEGIPESAARHRLGYATEDLRAELTRRRAAERRRTGGFSSWAAMLGLVDLRVWARRSLAALGAATVGGALIAWTVPVGTPTRQEAAAIAPVVLVEEVPPLDTRERPEVPAAPERPKAPRERAHHDAGRRFRAERFGVE